MEPLDSIGCIKSIQSDKKEKVYINTSKWYSRHIKVNVRVHDTLMLNNIRQSGVTTIANDKIKDGNY